MSWLDDLIGRGDEDEPEEDEDSGGGFIGDAIGGVAEDVRVRTIQELPFSGVLWEFVPPDGETPGNYNLTPQGRTAALIACAMAAYFVVMK